MSLSVEIEELLTGYLDNQLDAVELLKVKAALQDPAVQARYNDLRKMQEDLQLLAAIPQRGLPIDFAQRVLSIATAPAANSKSAPVDSRFPERSSHSTQLGPTRQPDRVANSRYRWAAAAVAVAASAMMAIWLPQVIERWSALPVEVAEKTQIDSSGEVVDRGQRADEVPLGRLAQRSDLMIRYIMTVDIELSENSSVATSLAPLLEQNRIDLIRGAKVEGEVKTALDKIQVTQPEEESTLPCEVYLLRASAQSLETILERLREDLVAYPIVRFGLAYDLPSDPLLDKLSLSEANGSPSMTNGPIVLGQAMANAVSNYVSADESFAVPLTVAEQQEFRASPFESVPPQGQLVGSQSRMSKSAWAIENQNIDSGPASFLLLFVRQR